MGQCELIVQISQQMKWAHGRALSMRAFRLLWASSVSSARPCHGICIAGQCGHIGLQLSPLTIHCEGPHSSLVQHLILCLMGQCEPVVQISQYMKWAHVLAPNYFQAAVGQYKLIVQISQQMKWAHWRVSSRRAFRLLWACSVSSSRPWHLHCRPMWPPWSAAIPTNCTL